MKQTVDIHLLGIDRRPAERQHVPGLCKELVNMQPTGSEEAPYWEPVPNVNRLKNASGVNFSADNAEDIVRVAWHVRNTVGSFSEGESESLRRLAVFYNDGTLELIDPDLGDGWEVVLSKEFDYGDGEYDAKFMRFKQTLIVSILLDGTAKEMGMIVDDRFIPFDFPELPVIQHYVSALNSYDNEEMDAGTYEGIREGSLFVRYAYRLHDGSLVKASEPFFLSMARRPSLTDPIYTYQLTFFNEGWRQIGDQDNLDFWKENISAIVVLAGGYEVSDHVPLTITPRGHRKDLEHILFYEIASFDFIDPEGRDQDQRTIQFDDKGENISSYPLADVSVSSGRLFAPVLHNYNSQLILGGASEGFPIPQAPAARRFYNAVFYAHYNASQVFVHVVSDIPHDGADDQDFFDVDGTNLEDITTVGSGVSSRLNEIRADVPEPSGDFSMTITGPKFTCTIQKSDFMAGDMVPLNRYSDNSETTHTIRLGVEIDTENGLYQRVSEDIKISTLATTYPEPTQIMLYTSTWCYPDRRAKRLFIWEKNGEEYDQIAALDLIVSKTQNFSYWMDDGAWLWGSEAEKELFGGSVNDKVNYFPNRVRVSEVNTPFTFLAGKTYYIGDSDNAITAFAANALAVSQGQFGQYPLYVFSENEIFALEQSDDPAITFGFQSPVSISHGTASEQTVTNLGRSVVFVYKEGIFTLEGGDPVEISQPINNYPGSPQIDFSSLRIASRQRAGNNELLVSDGETLLVYNTKYGRWYEVDRDRNFWFQASGELYGVDSDGIIYDERSLSADTVPVSIELDPVHFLEPEVLKRLYAIYLRGALTDHELTITFEGSSTVKETVALATRVRHRSVFSFGIALEGTLTPGTDYMQAISAQIEARYPQHTKIGV